MPIRGDDSLPGGTPDGPPEDETAPIGGANVTPARPLATSLPDDAPQSPAVQPRTSGEPSPAVLPSPTRPAPDLIAPARPSPDLRGVVQPVPAPRPRPAARAASEHGRAVPLAEGLPEDDVPAPVPTRPKVSGTRLPRADAEDMTRRLTLASVQFRKGQPGLAIAQVEELVELYPNAAAAYELLGDIYGSAPDAPPSPGATSPYTPYDPVKAQQAYERALEIEPGRVTTEAKLARMTLRGRESRLKNELGIAYAGAEAPVFASRGAPGARGMALSIAATALLPGLGQILRGEYLKGGAIVAGYLIAVLIWAALPESREVLGSLFRVHNNHPVPVGSGFAGGALLTVSTGIWLYALLDVVWISRKPK